jgi:hypothetical protein
MNKPTDFMLLQLFDEGDGSAAEGSEATAEIVNPQADESQVAADTGEETFDSLIKGKYKDDYDKKVQAAINRRLKNVKAAEDNLNTIAPMLKTLANYYGVDSSDYAALAGAVANDDSYYEKLAAEKGIDTALAKEITLMQAENESLNEYRQRAEEEERARERLNVWIQQAEAMKEIYPSFDLRTELENPDFVKLLESGIDVRTSFEVNHRDEIMSGFGQAVAKNVEKKVVNSVKANGLRPTENGVSASPSQNTKVNVSALTDEQIDEINRKVLMGEHFEYR